MFLRGKPKYLGWAKYLFFSHFKNEMLPIKDNLEYAPQNLSNKNHL